MATTVTNGQVDTLAAAVAAPWGPFTRVSDVSTFPTPNSEMDIEFTNALGGTVFATYEQMQIAAVRNRLGQQSAGFSYKTERIKDAIDDLATALAGYSGPPYSYSEYLDTIQALQTIDEIANL